MTRPAGRVSWSLRNVLLLRILLQGWWLPLAALLVSATAILLLGGSAFIGTIAAVTMVMSFAGFWVGTGTANLRNWPAATLVPGYSRGLFTATLVFLGVVLSAWAAVCCLVGNPGVLLGPGLLVGSVVALCLVPFRHYAQFFGAAIVSLPVLLAGAVLALGARKGWYDGTYEVLTKPASQAAALAAAGLALWVLRRVIDSPVRTGPPKPPATGNFRVQPSGLPITPVSDSLQTRWVKLIWGSTGLVGLALLLRLSGAPSLYSTIGFIIPWGCLVLYGGVFQLHHVPRGLSLSVVSQHRRLACGTGATGNRHHPPACVRLASGGTRRRHRPHVRHRGPGHAPRRSADRPDLRFDHACHRPGRRRTTAHRALDLAVLVQRRPPWHLDCREWVGSLGTGRRRLFRTGSRRARKCLRRSVSGHQDVVTSGGDGVRRGRCGACAPWCRR